MASLTPRAAKTAANDRCIQVVIFGEFTIYLRTPLADRPYKIKTIRVIAMNTTLKINICSSGDAASGETKRGKKARKNMDNLGFRILINTPFTAICPRLLAEFEDSTCF